MTVLDMERVVFGRPYIAVRSVDTPLEESPSSERLCAGAWLSAAVACSAQSLPGSPARGAVPRLLQGARHVRGVWRGFMKTAVRVCTDRCR